MGDGFALNPHKVVILSFTGEEIHTAIPYNGSVDNGKVFFTIILGFDINS